MLFYDWSAAIHCHHSLVGHTHHLLDHTHHLLGHARHLLGHAHHLLGHTRLLGSDKCCTNGWF